MILELENLPPRPCRTQCPECRQFIMTETVTSVSSVTWLVCFMTALIGYEAIPSILVKYLHENTSRPCFCLCRRCYSYWHMLPGLFTYNSVPVPSSFAAAWLVVASFPSASIGSNLPRTDVLSVDRQSKLSRSYERKAAGENVKLRLKEHQTST